ncbi:MAG: hypothetical protein BGO82_17305 [Devosia sp. 67-54]|uniref:hypothetical protein n=1 Tax=unclassified Devosia TaxID=196773 RepID=UPI00095DC7C9|nr:MULTISPECIES: hypothetical protein [unclassified Devosia]MBN9304135.1 hypothetical protein [Devosia sp.]OJX17966.1 MAG: hypothetical protein BGO82_17305 [Devosia sp. 67-54]
MTGTVSWETLLWVIGSNGVVLVVAWRILDWIGKQLSDRDLKIEAESARAKMIEKGLEDALAEFRTHVAERYATKDGVSDGLGRVEASLRELKDLINQMLLNQAMRPPPSDRPPPPRR